MRILAVVPLYPPHSLVGAWITTHDHLRHLVDRGHQVDVVAYLSLRDTYDLEGVTVHSRGQEPDADLVIAHLGDIGAGQLQADRLGVPLVYMVHGVADWSKLERCSLAVFNSANLRDASCWDGPSLVAWPTIHPERYRTTPGDRLTLINLSRDKGSALFWALAAANPQRRFLGVRGGYGKQIVRTMAQVDLERDPVLDMRFVYSRTRILLMPSIRESWGRVAMEAACSGIPTIAHPTAGLYEALGDACIFVDRDDLGGWAREIGRLDDPDEYAAASAAVQAKADALDPTAALNAVAAAVEAFAAVPA